MITAAATDVEFQGTYNNEPISKTLPRNYNNSASSSVPVSMLAQPVQSATGREAKVVLEYFDLDHSNPPPICNSANTSVSTTNLSVQASGVGWQPNNLSHRLSSISISSSSAFGNQNSSTDATNAPNSMMSVAGSVVNVPNPSGIVYKSVDFIKTEAFMRTRQDAELARAKNRSKE